MSAVDRHDNSVALDVRVDPANRQTKILVVDDNPIVLIQTAHLLRSAGYRVIEAANGADALRLADEDAPNIMLMDVVLGDANGVRLCQQIKAAERTRNIFVVLASVSEISSDQQALGLQEGADGYIARPISGKELVARMAAMARIQRAEAELRAAREQLEIRVKERTRELDRANAALHKAVGRLKQLSRRLVDVQEAERRHVAHELHDQVGQQLTGLKLCLNRFAETGDGEGAKLRAEAIDIIDGLVGRVRKLSLDLRPQMLDDLGLLPALKWHLSRFETQSGLTVSCRSDPIDRRLDARLETTLFRIAQEALTNVGRHAQASEVSVSLRLSGDDIVLIVADDGRGCDVNLTLESALSTGLSGMRERASLLNGSLSVASEPGSGMELTATLPALYRD